MMHTRPKQFVKLLYNKLVQIERGSDVTDEYIVSWMLYVSLDYE